jgi:hypothetical protein
MRPMSYSGQTLVPNRSCVLDNQLPVTKRCDSVGVQRSEQVLLDAIFQARQRAGIKATRRATEHASSDHETRGRSAERGLESAHIEVDHAQRQFDACEAAWWR